MSLLFLFPVFLMKKMARVGEKTHVSFARSFVTCLAGIIPFAGAAAHFPFSDGWARIGWTLKLSLLASQDYGSQRPTWCKCANHVGPTLGYSGVSNQSVPLSSMN